MASVDDRIVAMKFDNGAFETKVATTIASLDKLKSNLDFSNAKRGMDDLSASSRNFNLDGIGTATEHIAGKFSAMGAVAFSVISNLTTMAIHAGTQIVKSLALDQVMSGFHEYETNMNSIQTILSNTKSDATTLTDVNAALDQLNTYSDQTIYNFSQMAKNIGTFTAAGVNLDTSVQSIKGIANLAAISGSNADQASSAMYQLSQAMASGTVKLMDWNSIVNAGMGGEVFQKSLFETGKALGTIKGTKMETTFEEWTKAGNTFRGSLEDGWLTADVLTNTLQGFTGDLTEAQILAMGYTQDQVAGIMEMGKTGKAAATEVKTLTQLIGTVKESIGSGWTTTFRTIFGDFEEAKTTFTELNNAIGGFVSRSADARNNLLQGWKDLGGRTLLIEGLKSAFQAIAGVIKPISAAFRDIFPPMTSQRLFDFTQSFKDLMDNLKPSPATTVLITRAFRGVFAAFSIGIDIVKGIFGFFKMLFQLFTVQGDPNDGILGFAARLGDGIYALKTKLDNADTIKNFFLNLALTIKHLVTIATRYFNEFKAIILDVIDYFVGGFTGMYTNEGEGIFLFANKFGTALRSIKEFITEVIDYFSGGFSGMYTNEGEGIFLFANKVGTALRKITFWIKGLFDGADAGDGEKTFDMFGRLGDRFGWLVGLAHILGSVWEWVSGKFGAIGDALGNFVGFLKDKFAGLPQTIGDAVSKGDYSTVLDTINVGLLGGLVLMFKKGLDLPTGLFKNINKAFGELTGVLKTMQTEIKSEALLNIAIAVGVLTAAMVILSLMDSAALTKSLTAMAIGFGLLVGTMALLDKIATGVMDATKLTIMAAGLLILAGAILVMSIAAKILSTLDWDEMSKGLTGVSTLLGVIVLFVNQMDNPKGMITTGLGLIAVAIALNILALAVKSFAEMSWADMSKGMAGVASGLLIIAGALKLMPDGPNLLLQGLGLMAVATALNIIALACKSFAEMKWNEMVKGMAGIAAALLILAGALELMPNGASLALQGVGLLAISIGLLLISQAVKSMSKMSWGELAKGVAALASILLVLAVAAALMSGSIGGAVAMVIMAVAVKQLAKGLKEFAAMKWSDLLKGLAGLVLIFAALGLGALAMQPAIPALIGLGIALILVGAGFALFGLGASLVATAFAVIASAGSEGVATLIGVLDALIGHLPGIIVAFGEGLIQLALMIVEALPEIIGGLDDVILALLELIIRNIPKLAETFKTFILAMTDVLIEVTPQIVEAGFQLLLSLLQGIRDHIAEIVTVVVEIITEFLGALTDKVDDIIGAGVDFLIAMLKGISDSLDKIVVTMGEIIVKFIEEVGNQAQAIMDAGTAFIVKLIEGFADCVTEIGDAIVQMCVTFTEQCVVWAQKLADAGVAFILGLLKIGADALVAIAEGMFDLVTECLNKLADVIRNRSEELGKAGRNLAGAILDGLVAAFSFGPIRDKLMQAVKDIAGDMWDILSHPWDIFSPSHLTYWLAEMIMAGLAKGFIDDTSAVNSAGDAGNRVISSLQNSLSEIPAVIDGMEEFNPTITPVLDLTNVEREAGKLSSLLSSADVSAAYSQASSISAASFSSEEDTTSTKSIGSREIKFEQIINAPTALSTGDIYRQTRNQIAMAKEELAVL